MRPRTIELAKILMEKNPTMLKAAKHAYRRVLDMSWDDAEDYLFAKIDQSRFLDPERGRDQGMSQFTDEKSYKLGLEGYKRDR
jgi:feruloyl-CoA hydratase/lyase